jgi:membrane fusion protein (multidrug efflux system)
MKKLLLLAVPAIVLASCSGDKTGNKAEELAKLKKQKADIELKIKALEGDKKEGGKITPVSIVELKPAVFNAFIEVQSQVTGDANVVATAKAPGTVQAVLVQPGQSVSAGQVLATLDASTIDHQIETLIPTLNLQKSVYEKQQNLWKENIGTEVQLMSSKAQYESTQKQIAALKSQKDLYRIVAPISGVIDAVQLKVGDMAQPGNPMTGIRVVSYAKLKAEANLGENYLGKVKQGDPVTLIFPDTNDSVKAKLSYVGRAVDPLSRSFHVEVRLNNDARLHPNMSCIMKIANYENSKALIIPISVLQKTSKGTMVYVAAGNVAKLVPVTTGRISNGLVEVLSGLNTGDKVVVAGYQDLDEGEAIAIQ